VRPVYAPALVAWVGGPHFSIGIGIGGGGGVGVAWFPLGPRDVYCPSYHVSQRYVQNVNISNTTVINQTNITNVYNNVYVNKTVNVTNITYQNQTAPNAVTATSHQAFTSAQPVGRNLVKVDAREVASAPVAPLTPTVAPQQRSVLGAGASASVKPPAAVLSRPVVAKTAPPPAPISFVRQQQAIQANGGRPPAVSEMRRAQVENVQQARPNIKIAPPAQPGMPRNVQANRPVGNIQNNPANVQNAPANVQNNNNRPASVNNSSPANPANRPVNPPANNGNAPGNPKVYSDRPPSSRSNNSNRSNDVNPQLDQRHQQQVEQLHQKQDQQRQRIEQQQQQERQRVAQQNADQQRQQQRQQQIDQKHQQQLEQLEHRHDQEQQKLQQKQQQERQKEKPANKPPKEKEKEKDDKSHNHG